MSEQGATLEHCGTRCMPEPVIVPPTWNKGRYHGAIESVWRRAAKELSEAETVIIIGYSLPTTDQFFHYLFGLGCVGGHLLRRVILCNPDVEGAARFPGPACPSLPFCGSTRLHPP